MLGTSETTDRLDGEQSISGAEGRAVTDDRTRRSTPLAVVLLLALGALFTPVLSLSGDASATFSAKAEMAVTGTAAPLLRPGTEPRSDSAEGKPLPAATTPPAAVPGAFAHGRAEPHGPGAAPTALGRYTRDGRAPPYALV